MTTLNRSIVKTKKYKERVLQFGEGNFLRAFSDWMIQEMNEKADFDAGVVVVQPIEHGLIDLLNKQDGLYTLYLNGIKNGQAISETHLIDCIQRGINPYAEPEAFMEIAENPDLRFVISNTTEAGISFLETDKLEDRPQKSFPGKLTALLYNRYQTFKGDPSKGLIIIPCELIDRNGDNLKKYILKYIELWGLSNDFKDWVLSNSIFCNTLVDRIVPGFPKDKIEAIHKELGYKDQLVVEGEQFHLWVIEAPKEVEAEFPSEACGLNVIFTDNMEPYRTRKVRILNGAHTSLVPVGYLYGIDSVRESLEDDVVGRFLEQAVSQNICPTLDLPEEELNQFTNDVMDRFRNPYLHHELMSISLNSISKFKTRVLPSILEYIKRNNELPSHLLFSLAALIYFYKGDRNGTPINLNDDAKVLRFFQDAWQADDISAITQKVLSNTAFWDTDLTLINGLTEEVSAHLESISSNGMKKALQNFNSTYQN